MNSSKLGIEFLDDTSLQDVVIFPFNNFLSQQVCSLCKCMTMDIDLCHVEVPCFWVISHIIHKYWEILRNSEWF